MRLYIRRAYLTLSDLRNYCTRYYVNYLFFGGEKNSMQDEQAVML